VYFREQFKALLYTSDWECTIFIKGKKLFYLLKPKSTLYRNSVESDLFPFINFSFQLWKSKMSVEVDISPSQDGGVLKQILKEGVGNSLPPQGSKVTVHYTGTLLDGTKFDSSRDRDSPFEFDLGKGSVIKAWDIGVATMKKGEQAILTCAPNYAYGEGGSPPAIPPNATLKFDVSLKKCLNVYLQIKCRLKL